MDKQLRQLKTDKKAYGKLAGLLGLAAFLLLIPVIGDSYAELFFYLLFINVALAQSWNLLAGYTGLISLGHAAFFGIGAYTTALVMIWLKWPFFVALILGAAASMLFALIVSRPIFRLRGIYFTIGTMVLAEALRIWMINWEKTGGAQGVNLPLETALSYTTMYYIAFVLAAASVITLAVILRSKIGMGLRAIRDNERSARNSGVNIYRTKLTAFLISALITGLAGGIHAEYSGTIEPYSIFSINWTLTALVIVIVGGMGTITGPILGAFIVGLLGEFLIHYPTIHLIILGFILIAVIRFFPGGLRGALVTLYRLLTEGRSARKIAGNQSGADAK